MSSLAFLVTELQSLASETRRKHPEVREAAEKSLALLRASPEQATANLASDGPQSEDLLRPVFMGCATKNAKVVAISLGSLQRLIALKAVPQSAVPQIINTMNDCMSHGVDIQLRILQTLLSLITNFPEVHGDLLGDALLLCFKLQESRIAVVSSTAAATLRQLVMFVVDNVVEEDRKGIAPEPENMYEVTLPDGSTKSLTASSRDAFCVFEDLCLLANSEKPNFLHLDSLRKTFALELIESVLTNYHDLFRRRPELILLLQHHLCPLLLKALSERPVFPLTLRCTRVVFLLLKQFCHELETEAEVFLMLLIRIVSDESDGSAGSGGDPTSRTPWLRVLAMEIMRGLCNDAELIRTIYLRYDSNGSSSSPVLTSMVTALKRLVTEKPVILGVNARLQGIGGHNAESPSSATGESFSGMTGMAGMVAQAASATVSGVVGMMASNSGLSMEHSSMKLQCIDQLDKADAPPIPESYIYLLSVQCLISLCDGFLSSTYPLYTSIVVQKNQRVAPPAFDLPSLPPTEPSTKILQATRDIIETVWPALLAALSFVISTNLSDDLFVGILASYQAMTNVSGMLALSTPRDAFFTSLEKLAVPARVVSALDHTTFTDSTVPPTPRGTTLTENLGFGGDQQQPGLSDRNMACLKALINSAMFLAGSLGQSWFGVMEALQNADYVLTFKGTAIPGTMSPPAHSKRGSVLGPTRMTSQGPTVGDKTGSNHPLLTDLDAELLLVSIQRLFDASKNLEDGAFRDFVDALCRLSAAMVGMQSQADVVAVNTEDGHEKEGSDNATTSSSTLPIPMSRSESSTNMRRASGIFLPRTLKSGDFGIKKLGGISLLNIHRLVYRSPDVAWNIVTGHLLSVLRLPYAPQPIRVQAAKVLDDILVIAPRNITSTGTDMQAQVQQRVLDVLAQQVVLDGVSGPVGANSELRKMGLETLHQILQASGHTLIVGWEVIFAMLSSVAKPASSAVPLLSTSPSTDSVSASSSSSTTTLRNKPLPLGLGTSSTASSAADRNYSSLVKIAFQSLTLVCDSVSTLSPENLRLCISTLGQFGRQADTNIALTAAASLLWSVSDSIQAKRKDAEREKQFSELWMFLLLEVLGLCADSRPEVREGAIQTLFRTLQLYGATLSLETWEECIWQVTFPLLDALTAKIRGLDGAGGGSSSDMSGNREAWNESKILALNSIGSIFHSFLTSKIIHLESFTRAWETFVSHVQDCVLLDDRPVTAPALRCLEKALKTVEGAEKEEDVDSESGGKVGELWRASWRVCEEIGGAVLRRATSAQVQPQSPGVVGEGAYKPFTQESLVAFVDVVRATRGVSMKLDGKEWPLERLTRLVGILKGVLTYPNSPDYRPDIDALSPLQSIVMDVMAEIQLSVPGPASLVIRDLSECATLPFLAAFNAPSTSTSGGSTQPPKRVTYIAVAKKSMPWLVQLFLRFKDEKEVYLDGTVEAILSAYSIPVKLKYDCPAPSKYTNKDLPLWKTATSCFLTIVKECTAFLSGMSDDIPAERLEGIWRAILDVYRGGILADCTPALQFPLSTRETEENFDLTLIASLEIDVVPRLGNARIPDHLVGTLGKVLMRGSRVWEEGGGWDDVSHLSPVPVPVSAPAPPRSPQEKSRKKNKKGIQEPDSPREYEKETSLGPGSHLDSGTTEGGTLAVRERFSYWCFDLLFLVCSNVTEEQEQARKRLAALSLPSLLNRCRTTMVNYIADEGLRGDLPFPRARDEELVYVLRKLLKLRLYPGSLRAALSETPSEWSLDVPPLDSTVLSPSTLVSEAVSRSTVAHLFHFYPNLLEIAALPRRGSSSLSSSSSGSAWVRDGDEGGGMMDARGLARECLREVGRELGVGR